MSASFNQPPITEHESTARNGAESMLVDMRDRLRALLNDLDEAGEPVVAVHVAAALDVVEQRLLDGVTGVDADQGTGQDARAIAILVSQMADRMGPRAVEVAQRQLVGATGETLHAWTAIVRGLEQAQR